MGDWEMSPLPDYVSDHGHGEICYQVPLAINGVTTYAFALHADHQALQALVDSQLNAAPNGAVRYEVVGHSVLLTFLSAEHCTSVSETVGWLSDREAAFWLLLVEKRASGPARLVYWIPYLLIDAMSGMVTGREVWGYRKSLGTIDSPTAPESPAQFTASTIVFNTLSAATRGENAALVTVRRDGAIGPLEPVWRDLGDTFKQIERMIREGFNEFEMSDWLNAVTVAEGLVRLAATRRVPVINLKQFRDVRDSTKACYQALVECPCELVRLTGAGPLPGNFTAAIRSCASHPIVADLGLGTPVPNGVTELPVRFAFWVNMDFQTLDGSVIWEAT
jgi:hypothetical protein